MQSKSIYINFYYGYHFTNWFRIVKLGGFWLNMWFYRPHDPYVYKYTTPLQRSLVVKIENFTTEMLGFKNIKLVEAIYDKLSHYDARNEKIT